ncbi:MAG: CHASE domain-containing protein [Pseudomonadota bacterium]
MSMRSELSKIILLVLLYIATGKLGLLLAVPPGYATVIWPPSGIALGMLIVHGVRLWPGVLIGSFLLNCYISHAYSVADGLHYAKAMTALGIAIGSTLQAVVGRWLIQRFISLPLTLNYFKELLQLFLLSGPVACITAASIGTASLFYSDVLLAENIFKNWLTWWMGDVFGILIFLPLVLIAPNKEASLMWRGNVLSTLPVVAMLVLILPLGLTFYAWKISSESIYAQNTAEFQSLAVESEKALLYRLHSYENALLGAEGFFQGSEFVSREEWRRYAETVDIKKSFPGINGIGWVKPIISNEIENFQNRVRKDGMPSFIVHPTNTEFFNVITYIEPEKENRRALGLNIAFEKNRIEACNLSRDSGKPAITKKITLVQDDSKNAAFLLLHPMYRLNMSINTENERQKAFLGWIYAPFIAKNFLKDLTLSQSHTLNLRIYDGVNESDSALIYSSSNEKKIISKFKVVKKLEIMQQQWLVIWESTPAYEQNKRSDSPLFILIGGLVFTGLFGMFLIVSLVRRTETIEWLAGERKFGLPVAVFLLVAISSYLLYGILKEKELNYVKQTVDEEASKVQLLLHSQANEKLMAIKRMAQRWEMSGGTSFDLWQNDAQNYTDQLSGLKALEWIDSNYKVRWVEPLKGNEKVIGLDILFDAQREAALKGAAEKNSPTLTPPFDLVQGYKAFIAYIPLYVKNSFDGFMAGIFSIEDFFGGIVARELGEDYSLFIAYENKIIFKSTAKNNLSSAEWGNEKNLQIYDKNWTIKIVPTKKFIANQQTFLPMIIFIAGLVIAALSALTLRSILISRIKSMHLSKLNQLNTGILSSTAYLIISTDQNGMVVTFNKAAEEALGYRATEVIGKQTPALWHKPEEVIRRAVELSIEFDKHIEPGFDVFTFRPNQFGIESSEWTFVRKNHSTFLVNLTVTPLFNNVGEISGYLGVIEDITDKKTQSEALKTSEETFRSAMEHASIGMALVKPNGQWLKVNQALCDLIGYEKSELLASDFQSITHPNDLQQDLKFVQKMLLGELKTYQMEKRYIHKNGRIISVLLSVSLVRNVMNEPQYFISQMQDITERKEIERIKSEFISVVSHELRTPITSIRGSLGLIIGALSKDLPEKVKNLITIAHNNCERLILLINDILDIEKIASGQMRFDMRAESLALITHQAVEANEAYVQKFLISIDLEDIDKNIKVRLDSARYIQVLSNLISNAAKFSPQKSTIKIFAVVKKDIVRVCVQDCGPGIPEEFRSRIFGKFSQADSSVTRSKGGTGLGLHITKQIVEQMHGQIGFDTEMSKGTTFWLEFPLLKNTLDS